MLLETKKFIYDEYQNAKKTTIKHSLDNRTLVFNKCWNYVDSMKYVNFNTVTKPIMDFPGVITEEVDLSPITIEKLYKITIKR